LPVLWNQQRCSFVAPKTSRNAFQNPRAPSPKACQEVAARHGLVVEAQDITGVDLRWGFDAAFRVSIPLPDGTALDPERLRFEALAVAFGLSPADYGRQFSTGRELFKIRGIGAPPPQVPGSSSPPTKWLCCWRRGWGT
jgi:hypothetical protein